MVFYLVMETMVTTVFTTYGAKSLAFNPNKKLNKNKYLFT